MTLEEINAINRKLAEWAEVKPSRKCGWGNMGEACSGDKCDKCEGLVKIYPDYYRSNAAMDLLGVLVDRGFLSNLDVNSNGALIQLRCLESGTKKSAVHEFAISAAICRACLEVAEREGTQ